MTDFQRDVKAVVAVAMLGLSALAGLALVGFEIPPIVVGVVTLAAVAVIVAVRVYVYVRGEDNTLVDEHLEEFEEAIIKEHEDR
jgi:hypothetical protein